MAQKHRESCLFALVCCTAFYVRAAESAFTRDYTHVQSSPKLLSPSDGAASDFFGMDVDFMDSGSYITVGAPGHDSKKGAVYIFKHNYDNIQTAAGNTPVASWHQLHKISAPDGAAGDQYGATLAAARTTMSGLSFIAVAAPTATADSKANAGRVYVHHRDTGGSEKFGHVITLSATQEPTDGGMFGASLAVYNNLIVVGCPRCSMINNIGAEVAHCDLNVGRVFVFKYSGSAWAPLKWLSAFNKRQYDAFGSSVAVGTNGLMVGAMQHSRSTLLGYPDDRLDGGGVYVWDNEATNFVQFLSAPAAKDADDFHFGRSMSLAEDGRIFLVLGGNDEATDIIRYNRAFPSTTGWDFSPYMILSEFLSSSVSKGRPFATHGTIGVVGDVLHDRTGSVFIVSIKSCDLDRKRIIRRK